MKADVVRHKGRTPDDFADAAAAAVADGFARVKCAPFDGVRPHHGPETDPVRLGLQRLRAVRSAIGHDAGLMVDCHGRLGPQTCMAVLPELHDLGLGCVMPDVKHCGGLRAAMTVDALAAERDVTVAPHNPDGPVATLASRHLCAAAAAFEVLEYTIPLD